jgi:hypothetical protein
MIEPDAAYGKPDEAAKQGTEQDASFILGERRRPGRIEVNPALMPLLRGEAEPDMVDILKEAELLESDWESEEALKPARGIAYGLLLSLPLWAALLATCHIAIKFLTHS